MRVFLYPLSLPLSLSHSLSLCLSFRMQFTVIIMLLPTQRLLPYSLDLRRSMCFMYVSEYMVLVRSSYLQAETDSGNQYVCLATRTNDPRADPLSLSLSLYVTYSVCYTLPGVTVCLGLAAGIPWGFRLCFPFVSPSSTKTTGVGI